MNQTNPLARHEYKYYVPVSVYQHLIKDLNNFTTPDEYMLGRKFYNVYSVYFDNFNLKSYCDKIDGQTNRFKIRLRFYEPDVKSGQINAEIKYKLADNSFREKIIIKHEVFKKLISGESLSVDDIITNPKLKTFVAIQKSANFWPFIRINYERQALFSKVDRNIRLTFDREVSCCRVRGGNLNGSPIRVLPRGKMILEVKFPDYLPYWLVYILKKYSLSRSAISKYALAVQNLAVNSSLSVK